CRELAGKRERGAQKTPSAVIRDADFHQAGKPRPVPRVREAEDAFIDRHDIHDQGSETPSAYEGPFRRVVRETTVAESRFDLTQEFRPAADFDDHIDIVGYAWRLRGF